MMKVLAINGSPRKKNTFTALNLLIDNISSGDAKAETELVNLIDHDISMSMGDDAEIKDDMLFLHEKMKDADVIILASPSYFNNVTGLMKNFIDRSNRFWSDKELKGKKAVLLAIGEEKIEHIKGCIAALRSFACGVHMDVYDEVIFEDDNIIEDELKRLGEIIAGN